MRKAKYATHRIETEDIEHLIISSHNVEAIKDAGPSKLVNGSRISRVYTTADRAPFEVICEPEALSYQLFGHKTSFLDVAHYRMFVNEELVVCVRLLPTKLRKTQKENRNEQLAAVEFRSGRSLQVVAPAKTINRNIFHNSALVSSLPLNKKLRPIKEEPDDSTK